MSWERCEPPGGGRRNPVKRNGLGHLPEVWINPFRTHPYHNSYSAEFEHTQEEITPLHEQEAAGEVNVYYFRRLHCLPRRDNRLLSPGLS